MEYSAEHLFGRPKSLENSDLRVLMSSLAKNRLRPSLKGS